MDLLSAKKKRNINTMQYLHETCFNIFYNFVIVQ